MVAGMLAMHIFYIGTFLLLARLPNSKMFFVGKGVNGDKNPFV